MLDSIESCKVSKDADGSSTTSRVRVLGNTIKQIRVSLSKACARCAWVNNVEGFDNELLQTSKRGCDSFSGDRAPGICTASCRRIRLTGFLPEPGCGIP